VVFCFSPDVAVASCCWRKRGGCWHGVIFGDAITYDLQKGIRC
jgi:hypothetical protein